MIATDDIVLFFKIDGHFEFYVPPLQRNNLQYSRPKAARVMSYGVPFLKTQGDKKNGQQYKKPNKQV